MDYEKLYNTYYMQVYSFIMTLAKNHDTAEEITQKTFFKVLTTSKKYAGESKELTWLCAIAKNIFLDDARVQKRFTQDVEPLEKVKVDNFDKSLIDEDFAFRIHEVLHTLEEPYKEVFSLRVFGELSFLKIGMIFGKTESWARVTYHRGKIKIQERMELE